MLLMMLTLVGGFFLLVRSSYRSAQARARSGEPYRPEGKLRWGD